MTEKQQTQAQKPKELIWKKWWVWVIAVSIFFTIMGAFTDSPEEGKVEKIDGDVTEEEIVEDGIGVSRESVVSALEKSSFGFSFSGGERMIDGRENYVGNNEGKSGYNLVQLLGRADNLSEASITAFLGDDIGENLLSTSTVAAFAGIIDNNSVDWTTNEFEKIAINLTKPYSSTKVFEKKLFEISFKPSPYFNAISLIVTSI